MSTRDDALRLAEGNDWTDATADETPRAVSIVQSARMSRELNTKLIAEAERRGITPSKLICELVEQGLSSAADDAVSVRTVNDLHRAIDEVVRRAIHSGDDLDRAA